MIGRLAFVEAQEAAPLAVLKPYSP